MEIEAIVLACEIIVEDQKWQVGFAEIAESSLLHVHA